MNEFQILITKFDVENNGNMISVIATNESLGTKVTLASDLEQLIVLYDLLSEELIAEGILE